jgi:hypothetical protein
VYAIKERLVELFHGQFPFKPDDAFIADFHRRRLAGELAKVLDGAAG